MHFWYGLYNEDITAIPTISVTADPNTPHRSSKRAAADGVHPTDMGAALIGAMYEEHIRKILDPLVK